MQFKKRQNKSVAFPFEASIKMVEDKETIHILSNCFKALEELTAAKANNMPFVPLSVWLSELNNPAFIPSFTEEQEKLCIRCKDLLSSTVEELGYTTVDQNGFAINPSVGKDMREEGSAIINEETKE